MKLSDYIHERGLITSHVAKKAGISRQQIDQYGGAKRRLLTLRTAERIATAMTELGAPTTVADISTALLGGTKYGLN